MNGNDIMKAMNRIDERYISEAETERKISVKRGGLSKHAAKLAVGIAAAVALAIPAGAYAYKHFIHHDNVELYIKNADSLEGRDLVLNAQTEDDELRFTVDTLLCDGKQAFGVLTTERIGAKAGTALGAWDFAAAVVYADNGEFITHNWSGGAHYDGTEKVGQHRSRILIDVSDIDTSRGIKLLFWERAPKDDFYGNGKLLSGRKDWSDVPIRYNCELEIPIEPNVNVAKLYDSEGNEITLSEFEVYGDGNIVAPRDDFEHELNDGTEVSGNTEAIFHDFSLIDKNGEKHSMLDWSGSGYMEDYSYIYFEELIDMDDYIGVEINGVEYLKK